MATKEETLQAVKDAGINLADLAEALNPTEHADTEVRVNDEDNRKYGDASIYKVQANGFARPKMGVFTDSIPNLIGQLQEAYAELQPEKEFAPFVLTTED
jgi:hypothetical protein